MKHILFTLIASVGTILTTTAQLQTPKESPGAKIEQKVGLTDIKIEYSRPSKNDRVIFGELVPFDQVWRTGANENTKFTTSDVVIFGKDTLKAGTYALYTKPGKDSWEILFYTDATNWGTPEKWDDTKVAMKVSAKTSALSSVVETFSISIDNLEMESAGLTFTWDKTSVSVPFKVATSARVMANIDKVMAGPTANDYYRSASYYFSEKKDLKQALVWITKSIEMQGNYDSYWILRTKALIQAELGDKKGALETINLSLESAKKQQDQHYIDLNNASIKEWSK